MSKLLNTVLPFFDDFSHLNKSYADIRIYSPKNYVLPFQIKTDLPVAGTITGFRLLECDLKGVCSGNAYDLQIVIGDLTTGMHADHWYIINAGLVTASTIPFQNIVVEITVQSFVYYSELVSIFNYEIVEITPPA